MISNSNQNVWIIFFSSDVPISTLSFGRSLSPKNILSGADVYFECHVKANPTFYNITWRQNVSLSIFKFPVRNNLISYRPYIYRFSMHIYSYLVFLLYWIQSLSVMIPMRMIWNIIFGMCTLVKLILMAEFYRSEWFCVGLCRGNVCVRKTHGWSQHKLFHT